MVEAAVSGCKLAALEVLSPFVRIGVLTRLSGLGALFAFARIAGDCKATYQLLSYWQRIDELTGALSVEVGRSAIRTSACSFAGSRVCSAGGGVDACCSCMANWYACAAGLILEKDWS